MLKLGKVIVKNIIIVIDIFMFNIEYMEWFIVFVIVEFRIVDQLFVFGGFREVFKVISDIFGFSGVIWVIKKYLKGILEDIVKINQIVESYTRKVVQMYYLVRNFIF